LLIWENGISIIGQQKPIIALPVTTIAPNGKWDFKENNSSSAFKN
jgi:hypothetical protein